MSMGDGGDEPLTAGRASVTPRHVGGGAGLVDEHQPGGIELCLAVLPAGARRRYVLTLLLGGVRRLFLRLIP